MTDAERARQAMDDAQSNLSVRATETAKAAGLVAIAAAILALAEAVREKGKAA